MLKSYLKIACRNFIRNGFFTLINIAGLSVGLSCVILIFLFVNDETSYDQFHDEVDQIYAVTNTYTNGAEEISSLSQPFPAGQAMVQEIPEVEAYVNTTYPSRGALSIDGQQFGMEGRIIAATSKFFSLFNFPLNYGNPDEVLAHPGTVVISQELAKKYFTNENAIGKRITIDHLEKSEYVITGVAQNPPSNSYLTFDAVYSIESLSSTRNNRNSWNTSMYNLFIRTKNETDWDTIQPKLEPLVDTHIGTESMTQFSAIPLTDLYLSDLVNVDGFKGNYFYVYLFSTAALFILILACINYMNLSTAKAIKRGLEVGIRKVLGADKKQLMLQFLGESVILCLAALLLSFFIVQLALPYFNLFFDKELAFLSSGISLLVGLLVLTLIVGIVSGMYPAFYLSRLQSADILKKGTADPGKARLRKGLVIFQFGVSSLLIIATLVVSQQLNYTHNKDLGFANKEILYVPFRPHNADEANLFKQSMETHQATVSTSLATGIPGRFWFSNTNKFDLENPEKEFTAHIISADKNYAEVMEFDLLAGRFIDDERASEENSIVVNEAFVREMSWTSSEEAIGKDLATGETVVGVINDFHFQSLKKAISPVIIKPIGHSGGPFRGGNLLAVRFNSANLSELIPFMNERWNEQVSSDPLPVHFLNDELRKYYETEEKLGTAFFFFAGISIFIACMGLFGLAAFTAELKTREIAIRKVLGATITNIISLITKDYIKLVLVGFALAIPIAWYLMNQWLTDFAYRKEIDAVIFLFAGGISLFIALLTVSWQAIKAAMANPIEYLKSE